MALPGAKLFVGRLPYSKTEEEIAALFGSVGSVLEVHLIRDAQTQQKKGAAFVTMRDEESAAGAIAGLDGYFFPGTPRPISVSFAKGITVPPPAWATPEPMAQPPQQPDSPGLYRISHRGGTFVGSEVGIISGEIAQLQEGTFVQVLEVVDRPDLQRVRARIGNPGWISLVNTETGYRWAMKAEPRGQKRSLASASQGSTAPKIFVGQLPYSKTEEDVKMLFEMYGPVAEVALFRDNHGNSKGAAFVNFVDSADASRACELNGFQFEDSPRPIIVKFAAQDQMQAPKRQQLNAPPPAPGAEGAALAGAPHSQTGVAPPGMGPGMGPSMGAGTGCAGTGGAAMGGTAMGGGGMGGPAMGACGAGMGAGMGGCCGMGGCGMGMGGCGMGPCGMMGSCGWGPCMGGGMGGYY